MCSRLACVDVVGCVFVWDHGGRISVGGICAGGPPLFCHVRVASGADAMRVTFYLSNRKKQAKISDKIESVEYENRISTNLM